MFKNNRNFMFIFAGFIGLLFLFGCQSEDFSETDQTVSPISTKEIFTLTPSPEKEKRASKLKKYGVSASSFLKEGLTEYLPAYANDRRRTTAWVEGVDGFGKNEWIEITFPEREIKRIHIYSGYGKNEELWRQNNRVKRALLNLGDDYTQEILLEDLNKLQTIDLEQPQVTDQLKITIQEVYEGDKYNDTVISEIRYENEALSFLEDIKENDPPSNPQAETKVKWYDNPKERQIEVPIPYFEVIKAYETGIVQSGSYKNYRIITLQAGIELAERIYRFLEKPDTGELILLDRYSPQIWSEEDSIKVDGEWYLDDLEFPAEVNISASQHKLKQFNQSYFFGEYADPQIITSFSEQGLNNNLYESAKSNCLFFRTWDNVGYEYGVEFTFFDARTGIPEIVWEDGSKNENPYVYHSFHRFACPIVLEDYAPSELVQVGETSTEEKVWVFSNENLSYKFLADAFNNSYEFAEKEYKESDYNYPLIFIEDPFGRKLAFFDGISLVPAAERKPVIYLYPPEETKVQVKVFPDGKFTFVEPKLDKKGEWCVRARSDGSLFNCSNNTYYPYLFWEALVEYKNPPQEGFLLKEGEVKKRLPGILKMQGLRGREIDDFMAYWVPLLTERKYVVIKFFSQDYIDEKTPLIIDPQPDKVIRVMMHATLTDEPIEINSPFNYEDKQREGFTLVEWGGILDSL